MTLAASPSAQSTVRSLASLYYLRAMDEYTDQLKETARNALLSADWSTVVSAAEALLRQDADNREAHDLLDIASRRLSAARPGERRFMTVMFADVEGSTELSGRIDPEALREVLLAYQSACSTVIARYDGNIANYMGDGLLVYFGYPVAHEDDARRSVMAGLEMIQVVRELAPELEAAHGARVRLRIGIHSGEVVVAEMGSRRWRAPEDVVGHVPNMAARLQSVAQPDTVLISDATADLTRGFFDLEAVEQLTLKGIAEPVRAWRVGDELRASRFSARPGARPALVGRKPEQAELLALWREVAEGGAAAVYLEGEPGIGKSALVHWLVTLARASGAVVQEADCSSLHQSTPLHPFRTMLLEGVGQSVAPAPEELPVALRSLAPIHVREAGTLPLLESLLGLQDDPELARLTPDQRRYRTFEGLRGWLQPPGDAPSVLIVEDLQWADASSVQFLKEWLAHRPAGALTVITSREPPPPALLETALAADALTHLPIGRLPAEASTELVRSQLPPDPEPAVVADLVARGEGIPLFLEELARGTGGAGQASTLRELLASRVASVRAERPVAELAATIGREVDLGLLAAAAGGRDVEDDLDRLCHAGILEMISPRAAQFSHALVHEAMYESQLRARRRAAHAQVADTLIAAFPHTVELEPETLAHHLAEAGRHAESARAWKRAGEAALARASHQEALTAWRRALAEAEEAGEEVDDAFRLDLYIQRGMSATTVLGHTDDEAKRSFDAGLDLAGRLGREVEGLVIRWGVFTNALVGGEIQEALRLAETALERARATGREDLVCEWESALGYPLFYAGEFRRARDVLESCRERFRAHPQQRREHPMPQNPGAAGLIELAKARLLLGEPDGAIEAAREAIDVAQGLDPQTGPYSLAFTLFHGSEWCFLAGDRAAGARLATEVLRLSERFHFLQFQAFATVGSLSGPDADPGTASATIRAIIGLWKRAKARLALPFFYVMLARSHASSEEWEASLDAADASVEIARDTGEVVWLTEAHRLAAQALTALAHPADARSRSAEAIAVAMRQRSPWLTDLARETANTTLLEDRNGASRDRLDLLAALDFDELFRDPY